MIILIPPETTPTKIGVAQSGAKFFPISQCCSDSLLTSGISLFVCSSCREVVGLIRSFTTPTSVRLDGSMIDVYCSNMLLDSISQWTGWPAEMLKVEVDNS